GIDISSTGEKMVTSYLSVQEGALKSMITFFSFGEAGEVNSEKILGGFILEGSMTPFVKFLDDTHVVAVSDDRLNFYNLKGTPKLEREIKISHKINQVIYNDENVIICYEKSLGTLEEAAHTTIEVYSYEGDVVDQYQTSDTVRHITGEGSDYYVMLAHSIEYHHSKKMVWKSPYEKDAKSIMKIGKDQYLIVLQQGYELVKIKDI
ncbi:MAG: hypothetical protein H7X94_12810, partial [Vallitaleaceae bacterium]|nr:hypothetical protein [Vallitaleaceae bacterium]